MRSARVAVLPPYLAFVLSVLLVSPLGLAWTGAFGDSGARKVLDDAGPAAIPAWPVSPDLLIGEVVTGGASASDEYVEIVNASGTARDLAGLELVYVTSSGTTITRKATWATSQVLGPGHRLLVANASGRFAAAADATYSGGFAATGGALALRPVGGAPIDSVGWGDAANSFVEAAPAAAPPASQSIERVPGGAAGNRVDSNDNAADFVIQAQPVPEGLSAPPMPLPSPSPASPSPTVSIEPSIEPSVQPSASASPTITPTAEPSAEPTVSPEPSTEPTPTLPTPTEPPSASPTVTPSIEPTPSPSASPQPSPSPSPTASPSPTLTATPEPTPSATIPPSASPSATPGPAATPIGAARLQAIGDVVTVEGVLTTRLGELESGRAAFVQDASGGIALWLDAATTADVPVGTSVRVTGSVDSRYGQRTLRVATDDVVVVGSVELPAGLVVSTAASATEASEGWRVTTSGTIVDAIETLADGTSTLVDDGSGPVRIVVTAAALGDRTLSRGAAVTITGPLGQRDSSGLGSSGYRIFVVRGEDLEITAPAPTPTPSTSPTASASPEPSGSAEPTPSPDPDGTPDVPISDARATDVGSIVRVAGVVTAESGRLGTDGLIAIEDETGGIVVHLAAGSPVLRRGDWVRAQGIIAAPYGQLELRPAPGDISVDGCAPLPTPKLVSASAVGEAVEGTLVTVVGRRDGSVRRDADGGLSLLVRDVAGGSIRILADGSSGLAVSSFPAGRYLTLTGVVGQRATATGRLDGYRLWVRDAADIVKPAGDDASPTAKPSPTPRATATATPRRLTVGAAAALARSIPAGGSSSTVEVVGSALTSSGLLNTAGTQIVLGDAGGAILVVLPSGTSVREAGTELRLVGTLGLSLGAPRLLARSAEIVGQGGLPIASELRSAPTAGDEWQLVRISGRIEDFHKLGDRWRAEVLVGGVKVPIVSLSGSGVAVPSSPNGRLVVVQGIVRRPSPQASDRRFEIVLREPGDLALGPIAPTSKGAAGATSTGGPGTGPGAGAGTLAVDLSALRSHNGAQVRVGGIVDSVAAPLVTLDDGTAEGSLRLVADAAPYVDLLEEGDAIEATGIVALEPAGVVVLVSDPADLLRAGDLDGTNAPAASDAGRSSSATNATEASTLRSLVPDGRRGEGPGLAVVAAGLGIALAGSVGVAIGIVRRRRQGVLSPIRLRERLSTLGVVSDRRP